jgi:hypothetical protein
MPALTHFYIDMLCLYLGVYNLDFGPTLDLPLVESIKIQKLSNGYGRVCVFNAPVLRRLHLGRPERRLLEAFKSSPYSYLTLGLHLYADKIVKLVQPYLGQLSSLHVICGPHSSSLSVFPLFDESERVHSGTLSDLRITMRRRRLLGDGTMLEEPARRFHSQHSLNSLVVDWIDGSEFRMCR